MTNRYDAIVVGLGAMGSATLVQLARRRYRVLGLDAHQRGHGLGSSHGTSRIIREAYYEGPAYVPLVQRAYSLWRDLERESGRALLTITGGISVGRRDSIFVEGAIRSARQHALPYELLPRAEVERRYPGFRLPDDLVGVLEPHAGMLQPEHCVAAQLDLAARLGAEIHHGEPVLACKPDGSGAMVATVGARYSAARLIVTTGPWAAELLADLRLPLTVTRQVNVHLHAARPDLCTPERMPVSLWDVPEGWYFAIPGTAADPIKIGRHNPGEACTPHTIRRQIDDAETADLRRVADRYLPGASGPVARAITCLYTLTPDGHFIVDRHPDQSSIVIGCGFSGHGFKFASVIGEILADLAIEGTTRHDIGFLSATRFARS